jgi:hypothetical protein
VVRLLHLLAWVVVLAVSAPVRAEDPWLRDGADGTPQVQLYFFWSLTCPHCTAAHPHIEAIPQARPWVRLHALEVSRESRTTCVATRLARQIGRGGPPCRPGSFCGEMHVGWDGDEVTGAMIASASTLPRKRRRRVPAPCRPAGRHRHRPAADRRVDPASLSLPALTAGAGRARRLQSLRLLRPAVPAVDDGAPEEPRPHAGDRRRLRRHLRA